MPQLIEVPGYGEVEFPDDMTDDQIAQAIRANMDVPEPQQMAAPAEQPKAAQGFGQQVDSAISGIPRQIGLAARYGLEGLADVAGIAANPLAGASNRLLGTDLQTLRGATSGVLDRIGLPQPANATERVVGDASRLLAGGGGMVRGAQLAGKAAPVAAELAARPGLQAASAVGSGAAGGYYRETGGSPAGQMLAAIAGGVALPAAVAGGQALARGAGNFVNQFKQQPATINIQVRNALENAGYNPARVPKAVMSTLEADAAKAMQHGELSQDALRRLVDYRIVGANPARGNLTLNPVDITSQKNLAKVGANSSSAKLQGLAMRENNNTGTLLRTLNELGADTTDDAFAAGQKVLGGLNRTASTRQVAINRAYDNARAQTGIDADIDHAAFTQRAGDLLLENLLEGSLPPDVRRILNDAATGKLPLTVRAAEQIKTAMGNLQRSSADGSTRKAIGLVRQALDDAPIMQGQGDDAVAAFNQARGLNREWRALVEKTPALQALEDGVQPDRFVQDFIIRGAGKGNVMDVARLKNAVKDSPEALQAIRGQILAHLKSKATSGKPDEAMTFSQSGYNNALIGIGERKLRMFFDKAEIDKLKAVGRVAMYEQIQPSGSAVNNSNTAAMALGRLDDLAGRLPMGGFLQMGVTGPLKNVATTAQGSKFANVPKSLLAPAQKSPYTTRLPLPLLLTPGLLEQPGD